MSETIAKEAWRSLSQALNVEEATLRAVAQVESAGAGFIEPGLPKILFEGHCFHRLTQGRFDASNPSLSYPKWTTKYYSDARGEWNRLNAACELDRSAALQSTSWGAFQIMGFNYNWCGFSDVETFVAAQKAGIDSQLEGFARFISRNIFLRPLRAHDWAGFAKAYNGPGYAKNKYDQKLKAAYAAVQAAQGGPLVGRKKPALAKGKKTAQAHASLGRPAFFVMASGEPEVRRRQPRRRTVKPDVVDLRDWLYRPTVAHAPQAFLMLHDPRPKIGRAS